MWSFFFLDFFFPALRTHPLWWKLQSWFHFFRGILPKSENVCMWVKTG
jgi:hypothetical protein